MQLSLAYTVLAAALVMTQPAMASPARSKQNLTSYCDPGHRVTRPRIRSIFDAFVEEFYFQRDFQGAVDTYVSPNLIQHNPQIANGSQAQVNAVTAILANYDGPEFQLALVDEERGYGVVYSRFQGKQGTGLPVTGVADVYRFEGSCMVEHWDVIEALPPNSTNPVPFKR